MVPDTWSVVQERDIIPQAAKFAFLYKRPGARVIINGGGTCVVQPTPLDLHVQAGGASPHCGHGSASHVGVTSEEPDPLKKSHDAMTAAVSTALLLNQWC